MCEKIHMIDDFSITNNNDVHFRQIYEIYQRDIQHQSNKFG